MVARSVLFVCDLIPLVWLMAAHLGLEGLSKALALLNVPLAQPCEDTVNEGHWQIYLSWCNCESLKELNTIPVLSSVSDKNRSVNRFCYWPAKQKNFTFQESTEIKKPSSLKLSSSLQLLDLTVPCWIYPLCFMFLVIKERLRYNILAFLSVMA